MVQCVKIMLRIIECEGVAFICFNHVGWQQSVPMWDDQPTEEVASCFEATP